MTKFTSIPPRSRGALREPAASYRKYRVARPPGCWGRTWSQAPPWAAARSRLSPVQHSGLQLASSSYPFFPAYTGKPWTGGRGGSAYVAALRPLCLTAASPEPSSLRRLFKSRSAAYRNASETNICRIKSGGQKKNKTPLLLDIAFVWKLNTRPHRPNPLHCKQAQPHRAACHAPALCSSLVFSAGERP